MSEQDQEDETQEEPKLVGTWHSGQPGDPSIQPEPEEDPEPKKEGKKAKK